MEAARKRKKISDGTVSSAAPSQRPRPFVKWVGGKRQLLPQLLARIPKQFGTYHEPFVGGGALFFERLPNSAVLSDRNERLVRTYRAIRDSVEDVIALLSGYRHDKAFFLDLRSRDIDSGSDVEVAAWFLYLNRTAYNGLYRVNSRNVFNVPFGRYVSPRICDAENLRACSAALQHADVRHEGFEAVLDRARRGDFVYFDPPYVPLSATSNFSQYTADDFGRDQQVHLRDVALELKRRGVHVLLSNSSAGFVRELYRPYFEIEEVFATRMINSVGSKRGAVAELLMR